MSLCSQLDFFWDFKSRPRSLFAVHIVSFSCVFFRPAAHILLLEGDRGQVFCSSPPGCIVCLLLCTGEFPIVQEQNVQARWERDGQGWTVVTPEGCEVAAKTALFSTNTSRLDQMQCVRLTFSQHHNTVIMMRDTCCFFYFFYYLFSQMKS